MTDPYETTHQPTWCPGCGDFGIWTALKMALGKLNLGPHQVSIVYGIGCHGNEYNWVRTYGFVGLHGRAIPAAQGIKLANHKLHVIAVVGDGDCLGEGGNHFIHAARRNPDMTVILHDNQVYGLTTGQAAPTAKPGLKTKSTPEGVTDTPMNPLALAITTGATFVSRGFAGDIPHLSDLIVSAINHKGFSLVDSLQPCVSFNKDYPFTWYRERVYKLNETPATRLAAYEKALEWGDKIPTGIFYKEERPTSEDLEAALTGDPLVSLPAETGQLDNLLAEFY